MKCEKVELVHEYIVESAKTDRNGAFLCPRCGTKISPDDASEKLYSILETRVNDSGLEEVLIYCKKCRSQINLTGLSSES